jgi:hypothetical protein
MAKTLKTTFSPRERFTTWFHLTRNVNAASTREQDQVHDLWETLRLEQFDEDIAEAKKAGRDVGPDDYSDERELGFELGRDELAYLFSIYGRPMTAALSRLVRPIRVRLKDEQAASKIRVPEADDEAAEQ